MTTLPALVQQAPLEELLRRRPSPLPPAILHSERLDGFRNPQWVMRPMDDGERVAVTSALAEIESRLAPPRREWIVAILSRLSVHWPPKDEQAFGYVLSDMADDLLNYSEAHLVAVCAEWRKTEKWFPKSAELLEKLLNLDCMERVYRHRARVLLGQEQPHAFEIPATPRDESAVVVVDMERAKQMLDDFAAKRRA